MLALSDNVELVVLIEIGTSFRVSWMSGQAMRVRSLIKIRRDSAGLKKNARVRDVRRDGLILNGLESRGVGYTSFVCASAANDFGSGHSNKDFLSAERCSI